MHDALDVPLGVDDDHGGDLALFEQAQRLDRQRAGRIVTGVAVITSRP